MVYEWPISEGSYTGEAGLVYERPISEGSYTGEADLVYERPIQGTKSASNNQAEKS